MTVAKLHEMIGGWFVGNFSPVVLKRDDFEVAVKTYKAGAKEPKHVHKIAQEITVVATGKVKMNGQIYEAGSIITLSPGEATDFECLEDAVTCVVKTPSVKGDKYLV